MSLSVCPSLCLGLLPHIFILKLHFQTNMIWNYAFHYLLHSSLVLWLWLTQTGCNSECQCHHFQKVFRWSKLWSGTKNIHMFQNENTKCGRSFDFSVMWLIHSFLLRLILHWKWQQRMSCRSFLLICMTENVFNHRSIGNSWRFYYDYNSLSQPQVSHQVSDLNNLS